MSQRVFIGLGSNLGDSVALVKRAINAISTLTGTSLVRQSSFYQSTPLAGMDQPTYVNAVVEIDTSLTPESLLDQLQAIEAQCGRVRNAERWASRTLDLDILVFGDNEIRTERLTVPHVGIPERDFVVRPLAEIAADLVVPGMGDIKSLLARCPDRGIARMSE